MNERQRLLLRLIPFLALGLLLFGIYLALFVDIPEMVSVIQQANMMVYILAALILVLEALMFGLSWQYLLLPLSVKVSLSRIFVYVWVGTFADLLVPAESISGEVVKAYLMSREANANPGKVIASLVSQRMLGTFITTAALFLGFLALLGLNYAISGLMLQVLLIITIASGIVLAFLLAVCFKEEWTERLIRSSMAFLERISRGRFTLRRFQSRIVEGLRAFYESLQVLGSNPTTLIPPVLFYILAWLSSVAIVFLVFVSVGYMEPDIPTLIFKVVIVQVLLVAIKSIPFGVPAEVGLPDIFMTMAFMLFGIPPDVSAAVTVLTRILTVWAKFFIGFAAVQWVGVRALMESGVFGKAKDKV